MQGQLPLLHDYKSKDTISFTQSHILEHKYIQPHTKAKIP
jgi:hypothetical protein